MTGTIFGVWKLFGAIATHKFVITFCVGMELIHSDSNRLCSYITYMVIFCLVSPLGVSIGIGVTEAAAAAASQPEDGHYLTVGILQGLSAGTILYVVVFEVLQREKTKRKIPGLVQLVFILIGFAIMLCIEILGTSLQN